MVGQSVGERRPVVEHEFVVAVGSRRPPLHRLGKGVVFGPRLQHPEFYLGEEGFWIDLGIGSGRIGQQASRGNWECTNYPVPNTVQTSLCLCWPSRAHMGVIDSGGGYTPACNACKEERDKEVGPKRVDKATVDPEEVD